ncbi:PREDICTED: uncharacterized protein LOC109584983 [Amphimedon queenslandica]|uniref:Death domain-containing protein n=1 Tax=Amphimedon queenslandica TaxID=400682 RepID=A0A1X7U2H2_AMPQE|nr:PREDICTED: uncharacterized protein LOC109584983 [Amphimedon queenslandica]|eukprot:XP_019856445.1 PREDICTED: uncharacterized protein LOC109584983 [Amphimedon queenslandica]
MRDPPKTTHIYALWLKTNPNATRGQLIKALGVIRANALADKYKEWISSTGRATATSKDTNTRRHTPSVSKQSTAQQSLDITDLQKVLNLLQMLILTETGRDWV